MDGFSFILFDSRKSISFKIKLKFSAANIQQTYKRHIKIKL